jgi:hypothetical protein
MLCQRRSQMGPRRPVFVGPTERFPIQGYRGPRHGRRAGQTPNDTIGPGAQVRCERVPVHVPPEGVERGRTGSSVSEAKRLRDPCAIITSPFGDGTIAARATQPRTTRQREDGG